MWNYAYGGCGLYVTSAEYKIDDSPTGGDTFGGGCKTPPLTPQVLV